MIDSKTLAHYENGGKIRVSTWINKDAYVLKSESSLEGYPNPLATGDWEIYQEPKSELDELEDMLHAFRCDSPFVSAYNVFSEILKQLKRLEKNQENMKK